MGISMGLYFIHGIVTPEKSLNSPMEIEMWETQCPKLTIWAWYIPPMSGKFEDDLLIGLAH